MNSVINLWTKLLVLGMFCRNLFIARVNDVIPGDLIDEVIASL